MLDRYTVYPENLPETGRFSGFESDKYVSDILRLPKNRCNFQNLSNLHIRLWLQHQLSRNH